METVHSFRINNDSQRGREQQRKNKLGYNFKKVKPRWNRPTRCFFVPFPSRFSVSQHRLHYFKARETAGVLTTQRGTHESINLPAQKTSRRFRRSAHQTSKSKSKEKQSPPTHEPLKLKTRQDTAPPSHSPID